MAEYAEMDMNWFEEARIAVTYFRQGQEARQNANKGRSDMLREFHA